MNYPQLRKLKEKLYFTVEDLPDLLGIKPESARVLSSRYAKNGIFVRLKRNLYTLCENWENFNNQDFLKIANFLQVPSYVSFMTALSIYEITTQVQRGFFESACLKRSLKADIKGVTFNYYKIKKQFYFDFIKRDGVFIATREKSFVDAIYLYSFGKYKIDIDSIDVNKLNKNKLRGILRVFPQRTKLMVKKLCKI